MEDSAGYIVEMSTTSVDLPRLQVTHPPELDLAVIRSRNDKRKGRMEDGEIDTTVVAFQNILDRREVVKGVECTRSRIGCTLAQTGDIPYPYGLVHGRRHNKVVLGVEEG
jgi:hypothetical protein